MDSRALAERLRNSRATAAEDPRFREQQSAAEEARRQRTETAGKRAEQIIADLLAKLDDGAHRPGTQPEVMQTDGDSDGRKKAGAVLQNPAEGDFNFGGEEVFLKFGFDAHVWYSPPTGIEPVTFSLGRSRSSN